MIVTLEDLIAALRAGDYWEVIKDVGTLLLQIAALKPPVSKAHEMRATYDSYAKQDIDSLADALQAHVDDAKNGGLIKWADIVPLLKVVLTVAISLLGN